jgi:branched-chain amino acid transport system permease protein
MGQLIVMGWGGLFNLAQISLAAVGAYVVAILTTDYQVYFWWAFLLAPVVSVLVAIPLVLISQRLKSDYFAVASLAFALVIQSVLINWRSVTHGVLGVTGIPRPSVFGLVLEQNLTFLLLVLVVWLFCVSIIWCLNRSSLKLFLVAQSEFEEGLSSVGVSSGRCRMVAFIIAAFFSGIAGAITASYISFIDPSSFALTEMIFLLSILVLSGMRSLKVLFFSTVFLVTVPELLRFTDVPSSILGPFRQLMFAAILFIVIYYRRTLIFPSVRGV